MPARKVSKPSPIPPPDAERVCSVCGCNWALHGKKEPSLEDCVRLLKAELEMARLEKILQPQPIQVIPPEKVRGPYREEPYIGKGPERPPRWTCREPSEENVCSKPLGIITANGYATPFSI
jgi:hypothetical protein